MNEELQTPVEGTEPTEEVTPQVDPEQETLETPPAEEVPEETEQTSPQPEEQPEDPYKKKFVESQREAILQNERLKVKDARIEHLTTKDTPTDDEMRSLFPEWDQLDDYNKRVLTNQEAVSRRALRAEARADALATKQEFDDRLDDFLETPPDEYKNLSGRESDFRRFAKKKENVGLSLPILAKAFLFDLSDEITPEHKPTLTPGLEKGSGGPRQAPKPKKIFGEEAKRLRETDYKEWKRLVLAGQIEEEL